ncbi:MAG TPA: hypothetical protein VFC44_21075 [Candidatus Saccharimonadales bacterium]|nr:hypothetical protein [Candidatus Saccharimonadales bacterium]
MRLRPKASGPLFRCFAAATLLTWIGAQALCQAHCLTEGCHDEGGDASCHSVKVASSHHGNEDHGSQPCDDDRCAGASCQILKSALIGHGTLPLVTPQLSLLHIVAPFMLMLDATEIEPVAFFSRQASPRKWVFTPEVCLGPALRSHAPPAFHYANQ